MDRISILALHGYHGSAQVLRRQIAPLAAALPLSIDLTYVDAPTIARGDFGWWHEGFAGWETTRDWVAGLISEQHFDGVIGFSQGAALAGLLLATQESAAVDDPTLAFGFRFGVMIGGFTSEEPKHAALFRRKLTTPSLHVTGRADAVVPIHDSLFLAERFADPVVVEHGGGHVIPADPRVLRPIVEFFEQQAHSAHPPAAPPRSAPLKK